MLDTFIKCFMPILENNNIRKTNYPQPRFTCAQNIVTYITEQQYGIDSNNNKNNKHDYTENDETNNVHPPLCTSLQYRDQYKMLEYYTKRKLQHTDSIKYYAIQDEYATI